MTVPTMEPVENETTAKNSRRTQEGRRITYHLTVEQQPERARACGQGAKSSTDRRPVDPPPIVKLVMTEGETGAHDITFEHRTNFLLYATLEEARPIAQPRGIPPNSVVLTGTPVAGVSYLEKPTQGGYFVFSDLSVRNEGFYRLIFSLYEEVKLPQDLDAVEPGTPLQPLNMMHCRCEVKSAPFKVYSAKKFPGLLESTEMSKVVSDQGCRVRIRRDIRMRRRENKDLKNEWNDREDGTVLDKDEGSRKQEQDQMLADLNNSHSRAFPDNATSVVKSEASSNPSFVNGSSMSQYSNLNQHVFASQVNASIPQPQPAGPVQQQQQSYQQQYEHPHASPYYEQVPQHSHQVPQFPHQRQPVQYSIPQQHMYPLPESSYAYQPQQTAHSVGSHQQTLKPVASETRANISGDPLSHSRRESYHYQSLPQLDRRPSYVSSPYENPYAQMDPQQSPVHDQAPSVYRSSTTSSTHSVPLPPFKALDGTNVDGSTAPSYQNQAQAYGQGYQDSGLVPRPPTQYLSNGSVSTSGKRSYGSVFNTQHIEEPLHSGARPDLDSNGDNSPATDEEFDFTTLNYRRADGRISTMTWGGLPT